MSRPATEFEHADHDRDNRKHASRPSDRGQRYAVAALIGECEAIAASGRLTEPAEKSLRIVVAHALAAFQMPSLPERRT